MFAGEVAGTLPGGWFTPPAPAPRGGMPDPLYLFAEQPWWTQPRARLEAREARLRELRREIGLLPDEVAEDADDAATEAIETAVARIVEHPHDTEAETFRRVAEQRRHYLVAYARVRRASAQIIADSFKAEVISRLNEVQNLEAVARRLEAEAVETERQARARIQSIRDDDDAVFSLLGKIL